MKPNQQDKIYKDIIEKYKQANKRINQFLIKQVQLYLLKLQIGYHKRKGRAFRIISKGI